MSKRKPQSRTPFTDAFKKALEETTNDNALSAYIARQAAIDDAYAQADAKSPHSQVHINISTATK